MGIILQVVIDFSFAKSLKEEGIIPNPDGASDDVCIFTLQSQVRTIFLPPAPTYSFLLSLSLSHHLILSPLSLFSVPLPVSLFQQIKDRYERWDKLDLDDEEQAFLSIFLYNITNGDELSSGTPPSFQEVGPYTYRITAENFDVAFSNKSTCLFTSIYLSISLSLYLSIYLFVVLSSSLSNPSLSRL